MGARYQPYPEYKDSGIEWLGKIPTTWKLSPLKYLATIKNGQDYKAVQVDEGYPVMGSGGQFAYASAFMYDKPSVLLGRKGTVDKPLYINQPFWTVDTMYYTEINEDVDAKYLYYLALTIQFGRYITSTALPSMTQENLANYTFAIPEEKQERNRIADFLDHETAKIDTLIDKQQQLIKLLKEKRQAVISHAVTKGLNPDVPMKDSGVEWLGEVPEHWNLVPLKHLSPEITVGIVVTPAKYYADEGVPCFRSLNIRENSLNTNNFVYISEESNKVLGKSQVKVGDILVVRSGQPGTAAVVTQDFDGVNCIDLIIVRSSVSFYSDFICFQLNSEFSKFQVSSGSDGAIQQHFNVEVAKSLLICLPSIEEQLRIANYISQKNKKFDLLMNNTEKQIGLLQERRAALISAAVTGKIDVREVALLA